MVTERDVFLLGLDSTSQEAFLLACARAGEQGRHLSLPDPLRSGWGRAHFKGKDANPVCLIQSPCLFALPSDPSGMDSPTPFNSFIEV